MKNKFIAIAIFALGSSLLTYKHFSPNTQGGDISLASSKTPKLNFGAQAGIKYPTVEMKPKAAKRDIKKGYLYYTPEQRDAARVVIANGLVYDQDGGLVSTSNNFNNVMNYVMDKSGNFYIFDEFTNPKTRHSCIFGNQTDVVSGAGNISIKQGQILSIDSDSGHYPTALVFRNVLKELQAKGVDTSKF